MIASVTGSPRIYAVQNSLAAIVFAVLLSAQSVAYLLYLHPSTEQFWMLSIQLNRITSPILGIFDFGFGWGPSLSFPVLLAITILPLAAWRVRSWLGTAISGHLALAACIIMTVGAVRRIGPIERTASLSPYGGIPPVDANSLCLAAMTIAMIVLCLINHAMFFRDVKQAT